MVLVGRVLVVIGPERKACFLGQSRQGYFGRGIRDLRALVEEHRGILFAQDLVCPLLVIEPAKPDFGAILEREIPIRLVGLELPAGEAQAHHLGERVEPHGLLHMVEAKADNRMPALGLLSPDGDGPEDRERLPRAGAPVIELVHSARRQQVTSLVLPARELKTCLLGW